MTKRKDKVSNPHAVSLAKLRAASMTPERRKEISIKAANASKLKAKKARRRLEQETLL